MKKLYRKILTLRLHRYDLVQTSTNVATVSGSGGSQVTLPSAGVITAGNTVYKNASGQWAQASCVSGAAALLSGFGTQFGIALNNAPAAGMPLTAFVPTAGQSCQVNVGATTVIGTIYCISMNNPGAIAPLADWITPNQYLTYLGYGVTTGGVIDMILALPTNIKHT
jgi:hypothetical protein